MSEEPIIDLEPRAPFSWRIVLTMVGAWIAVLVMALTFKVAMLRMLLPLIATLLVIYLGVCTVLFLKNRK